MPVTAREETFPWAAAGVAVLCLILILGVASKHARRTHLD